MIPATSHELAQAFGLAGAGPLPTYRGLARLMREHVARSAPMRQAELTRKLKRLCRAAGFEEKGTQDRLKEVLEQLLAVGDIVSIYSEGGLSPQPQEEADLDSSEPIDPVKPLAEGAYLVPGLLTLVRFERVVLVTGSWPGDRAPYDLQSEEDSMGSVARWCRLESASGVLNGYSITDADWSTPDDWLGRYPVAELLEDRLGETRDSKQDLKAQRAQLWELIQGELRPERAGAGENVRLIAGAPGGFFGRYQDLSGRWRHAKACPDGTWLGVRVQKVGSKQERPTAMLGVMRGGELVESTDVRSWEEFRWALLSKGEVEGQPEQLVVEGDSLRQTCPLPTLLQRLLLLLPNLDAEKSRWRYQLRGEIGRSLLPVIERVGGVRV